MVEDGPREEVGEVLLYNTLLFKWDRLEEGYVYIAEGRIQETGEGEPPEDLRHAPLVYNLPGKLVLPGFTSPLTHLTLYPLRDRIGVTMEFSWAWHLASKISPDDAKNLALLALKHLVEHGFTAIAYMDPHPEAIAEAVEEVGLRATALVPLDAPEGVDPEALDRLRERGFPAQPASLYGDEPRGSIVYLRRLPGDRDMTLGGQIGPRSIACHPEYQGFGDPAAFCVGHNLQYSTRWLNGELGFRSNISYWSAHKLTLEGLGMIVGEDVRWLEKGSPADLVVVDLGSVPFAGMEEKGLSSILFSTEYHVPRVETLVSRGQVLVDGGEELVFHRDALSRGARVALGLRRAPV